MPTALITGITGQDGSYLADFLLAKGYRVIGMVRRSSTVTFERIQHIQDDIIIIQGDHGPWLQSKAKRMQILNAYYLPGHNDQLYPTITPVNSFRLVFNHYFGATYPLLPDQSYFSTYDDPFDTRFVPNDAPGCAP